MEDETNNTETNQETEQKFWETEVEGNVVKIPYEALENLPDDVPVLLKERGTIVKRPLKDVKNERQMLDEFHRKQDEFKKKEDEYKQKIAQLERTPKEEVVGKTAREVYQTSGLDNKELLKTITDAETINPLDDPNLYAKTQADLAKKLYNEILKVAKEQTDFRSELNEKEQKSLKANRAKELFDLQFDEAKQKYDWIDPRKGNLKFNEVKFALLQQTAGLVDADGKKVNENRPLIELAEEVETKYSKLIEDERKGYVKQKEDLQDKSGLTPGFSSNVPKVEQLTTEEAIKKYKVKTPYEE